MPNIMILAQAVLKIFRSQCLSLKMDIIQSHNHRQAVLQTLCSQCWFTIQGVKVGKGHNSVKYLQNFAKIQSDHL